MIGQNLLPPDELLGRNAARNKLIYLLYQEGRKVADIAKLWPLSAQQVYNVIRRIREKLGGRRLDWDVKVMPK